MIKAGWARCGLADVLRQTEEQKVEAMSLCISEPNPVLGDEEEQQSDGDSADDEEEEEVSGAVRGGPAEVD